MNKNQHYILIKTDKKPASPWEEFKQVFSRSIKPELLKGLGIVFGVMWKRDCHTTQYPLEKLPIGGRYRAVHRLLLLLESGNERCIGCGLCEKICISNCIRMDTHYGKDGRKHITGYTINFGRCIYCGFCAEVCPELAIVHGADYENSSEQRAHFARKEDMQTPIDLFKAGNQEEFPGFGTPSDDADRKIKKTPLRLTREGNDV